MSSSTTWLRQRSLRLLRYLCVWQINSSLVRLHGNSLPVDMAQVLGNLIAERLPTRQAVLWRKALANGNHGFRRGPGPGDRSASRSVFPQTLWPIEAVLMVYPGKRTYGRGEVILWELKLFGDCADHDRFLEVFLPAMEEASYTVDERWQRRNGLWGHFDVRAVHVANGLRWEPLVQDGRLDLRYRPTPWQWAEGREGIASRGPRVLRRLEWVNAFDLTLPAMPGSQPSPTLESQEGIPSSLTHVLALLVARLNHLWGSGSGDPLELPEFLDETQRRALALALAKGADIHPQYHNLVPAPKDMLGKWIGTQSFSSLPPPLLPYLDLAAIVHIGRYTQFGCGSFLLR